MVLLHDHLNAFLDLGQDGVDIAGKFGFRDADRRHDSMIARLPYPLLPCAIGAMSPMVRSSKIVFHFGRTKGFTEGDER